MKTILKPFIMMMLCFVSLTGCSQVKNDVEETADRFTGKVEIMWDDVKDEFDQIEQDITGNDEFMNSTSEDIRNLTTTIKDGYEKIKDGITQDNQEEAKKVYEAATKLEYIKKNSQVQFSDEEKEILELGEKTKVLLKHYYGNGEGNFSEAVEDVKERLDKLNDFSDEKWQELKNKLE